MTIGERIMKARKAVGLTQEELGKRIGVSASMVSQYETGARTPKVGTIQRFSDALNAPIMDVLTDERRAAVARLCCLWRPGCSLMPAMDAGTTGAVQSVGVTLF